MVCSVFDGSNLIQRYDCKTLIPWFVTQGVLRYRIKYSVSRHLTCMLEYVMALTSVPCGCLVRSNVSPSLVESNENTHTYRRDGIDHIQDTVNLNNWTNHLKYYEHIIQLRCCNNKNVLNRFWRMFFQLSTKRKNSSMRHASGHTQYHV